MPISVVSPHLLLNARAIPLFRSMPFRTLLPLFSLPALARVDDFLVSPLPLRAHGAASSSLDAPGVHSHAIHGMSLRSANTSKQRRPSAPHVSHPESIVVDQLKEGSVHPGEWFHRWVLEYALHITDVHSLSQGLASTLEATDDVGLLFPVTCRVAPGGTSAAPYRFVVHGRSLSLVAAIVPGKSTRALCVPSLTDDEIRGLQGDLPSHDSFPGAFYVFTHDHHALGWTTIQSTSLKLGNETTNPRQFLYLVKFSGSLFSFAYQHQPFARCSPL